MRTVRLVCVMGVLGAVAGMAAAGQKAKAGKPKAKAGPLEAVMRRALNPKDDDVGPWVAQKYEYTNRIGDRLFAFVTYARRYQDIIRQYSPGSDEQVEIPVDSDKYVVFVLMRWGNIGRKTPRKKGYSHWSGHVKVYGGTAHMTTTHRFDGYDHEIKTKSADTVAWKSRTTSHYDSVLVRLEIPKSSTTVTLKAGGFGEKLFTKRIPPAVEQKLQASRDVGAAKGKAAKKAKKAANRKKRAKKAGEPDAAEVKLKPVDKKPVKAPQPVIRPERPPEPAPEEKAENLLGVARMYLGVGKVSKAETALLKLLDDYPDTPAAKVARKALDAPGKLTREALKKAAERDDEVPD